MGAYVPAQQVDALYERCSVHVANPTDPLMVQSVKRALANLLMIERAFEDAASTVKVSAPVRDYEIAMRAQEIKVSAVEFDGAEYAAKVAAPSDAQLQELYNRFADVDAETSPDLRDNPFGIGYRFPHRVKLQYIEVPRAEIRKSVENERSTYDWNVAASIYYKTHQEEFSTTTRPAGASATAPTTRVARTFSDAHKDALEAVIVPEVERRQTDIQRYINAVLTEDYALWNDKSTSRPTSLKVPYNDYAYFQKLAAELQQRYHIAARVETMGSLESRRALMQKGELAQVTTFGGISLPIYATLTTAEYEKLQKRIPSLPRPLEVCQPSQSLNSAEKDLFFFRVVEIDPARKAHDLGEVKEQVARDWRLMESVKLAKAAAEEFLAAARTKGFESQAQALKKLSLKSEFFRRGMPVVGMHMDDALADRFQVQAAGLLALKARGDLQPMIIIELAKEGRVFATRLDDVLAQLKPEHVAYMEVAATEQLERELQQRLQSRWFDYANVVKRLGYVAENKDESASPVPESESPADWPQL